MTSLRTRRLVTRLRSTRGATLVEAAIITPLLLLITFSIVDFGTMFYVYLSLENGVGQATRYAVTGNAVSGQSREQSIRLAMRRVTPTLTLEDDAFTFSHLPPNSTTWLAGSGGENDIGKVTVNYQWSLMTPLIRPFFTNGLVNVRVESAMKNERKFQ